jgi:hypothetical protein
MKGGAKYQMPTYLARNSPKGLRLNAQIHQFWCNGTKNLLAKISRYFLSRVGILVTYPGWIALT